jgi:hypothetical protein
MVAYCCKDQNGTGSVIEPIFWKLFLHICRYIYPLVKDTYTFTLHSVNLLYNLSSFFDLHGSLSGKIYSVKNNYFYLLGVTS